MRGRLTVGVAGMLVLMMLPMASATATPPTDVTFEYDFFFEPPFGPFGEFEATGSAVDEGLMCPSGFLEDAGFKQSHFGKNVTPIDRFVCYEGNGFGPDDTFIMKVQVHIDFPDLSGNWVMKSGTGAFEDIHGTGTTDGFFIFEPAFGVHEIRAGQMHLD